MFRSRSAPILVALLAMTLVAFPLPVARAEVLILEDWESGADGWDANAGQRVVCEEGDCTLELRWGTARLPTTLPLADAVMLSVDLRIPPTASGKDYVILDVASTSVGSGGGWLFLELRNASTVPDAAFGVFGGATPTRVFGAWTPNETHTVRILASPATRLAMAQVLDDAGVIVARSELYPTPSLDGVRSLQVRADSNALRRVGDVRLDTIGPQAAPTLRAEAGPNAGQVTVAWEQEANALGYHVAHELRRSGPGEDRRLIATFPPGSPSTHVDSGRERGVEYQYELTAKSPAGAAAAVTSVVAVGRPDAPRNVAASFGIDAPRRIEVWWDAPFHWGGAPLERYVVFRAVGNGAPEAIATVDPFARRIVDEPTGAPDGALLRYTVVAENGIAASLASHGACVRALPEEAALPLPIVVDATPC